MILLPASGYCKRDGSGFGFFAQHPEEGERKGSAHGNIVGGQKQLRFSVRNGEKSRDIEALRGKDNVRFSGR